MIGLAKLSGAPTHADVEYKVSNYYFGFQVVQVFLVATLSSAASGAAEQLIKNPGQVFSLLGSSIPTASNFYLSYIIVQGLGVVSGLLANVSGLIVKPLLAKFLGSTPRKLFTRWNGLNSIKYGTVFPIYTNLLVIGKFPIFMPSLIKTNSSKPLSTQSLHPWLPS
jgi:calcium permeable stress-gated cation channel